MQEDSTRRALLGTAMLVGAAVATGGAANPSLPGGAADPSLPGGAADPSLPAGAAGLPPPDAPAGLWSASYWATKQRDGQGIQLAVYRKRMGAPAPGQAALPVLVLVHGSSPAALASFDLTIPGNDGYSLMNVFARLGYDVWTLDHEGYGRSTRTDANSDIASGVADLVVATGLIMKETGQTRMHMMGESSGALRAGAFAMAHPERMGRLVLEAFTYTGEGSPTLGKRAEQLEYYRTHNRRPRDRAMLESIFTRDHPGTTDPAVARAFVEKEMVNGDTVPTGTYLDMTSNLPVVDPAKVLCPVLLIKGEYDGISSLADLESFFAKLPNGDRQLSIVAGAAHAITMSRSYKSFQHIVQAFLSIPDPPSA